MSGTVSGKTFSWKGANNSLADSSLSLFKPIEGVLYFCEIKSLITKCKF